MKRLLILAAFSLTAFGVLAYLEAVSVTRPLLHVSQKQPELILVTGFNGKLDMPRDEYGRALAAAESRGSHEELVAYLNENPDKLGKIPIDEADARLKPVMKDGINPLAESSVSFIVVGDIMLSRGVRYQLVRVGDWSASFRKVADRLSSYDITFGNLETAVSSRFRSTSTGLAFSSDPRTIEGMKLAGFDALSLANNHATNFGLTAFADTLANFSGTGIALFGGGNSDTEARRCADFEVRNERICLLGYNTINGSIEAKESRPGVVYVHAAPFSPFDQADLDKAASDVKRAKEAGKFVIVYPHWGVEYRHDPIPDQIKIGHALIDAGADAVIGTHAHWVQGAEFYKGKLIAYSLGNFIFDQGIGKYDRQVVQGVAAEGLIRNGKLVYINFLPLRIVNQLYPEFLDSNSPEGTQILSDIASHSLTKEFK